MIQILTDSALCQVAAWNRANPYFSVELPECGCVGVQICWINAVKVRLGDCIVKVDVFCHVLGFDFCVSLLRQRVLMCFDIEITG